MKRTITTSLIPPDGDHADWAVNLSPRRRAARHPRRQAYHGRARLDERGPRERGVLEGLGPLRRRKPSTASLSRRDRSGIARITARFQTAKSALGDCEFKVVFACPGRGRHNQAGRQHPGPRPPAVRPRTGKVIWMSLRKQSLPLKGLPHKHRKQPVRRQPALDRRQARRRQDLVLLRRQADQRAADRSGHESPDLVRRAADHHEDQDHEADRRGSVGQADDRLQLRRPPSK